MKLRILALLVVIAAAVPCIAQQPDPMHTKGALNCRYWNSIDEKGRVFFIAGFAEAEALLGPKHASDTSTVGEAAKGITAICARPENGRIWIAYAKLAFEAQSKGSTQSEVEHLLEQARESASQP